jgi:penicillin-insensitive murein endopeptidase
MLLRTVAALLLLAPLLAGPAGATPPAPTAKPLPLSQRVTRLPEAPARQLFKAVRHGAQMQSASLGYYTRGCLAGGVKLEDNGPAWQAMRLSRNRHWAHPNLIRLVKRLAADAKQNDGWNGLLVGDLSMPRGGPMWPSHASHQIGLDADIWLTQMPDRRLTRRERETKSATFMLTSDHLSVNREVWTPNHARLIKRAASYREVQRILVHPAIKKELCETAGADRAWLSKVRPVRGHNYHFHIRIRCQPGSAGCTPQKGPNGDDGCGAELDRWYKWLHARLKPRPKTDETKPRKPRKKRRLLTLDDLPRECRAVLRADDVVVAPAPIPAARNQ